VQGGEGGKAGEGGEGGKTLSDGCFRVVITYGKGCKKRINLRNDYGYIQPL